MTSVKREYPYDNKRPKFDQFTVNVIILASDGSSVLDEIENDEDGKRLFRFSVDKVKQNSSGDYVVADEIRIVCVASKGKFRWDYRDKSADIFAIVCDKYDNVIISFDYSDCKIHLLNSQGILVTKLVTAEDYASSLSIDRNGYLWRGQNKKLNNYQIFEIM